jgi:dsDNA-specific endonuclease/ATPase MutS2
MSSDNPTPADPKPEGGDWKAPASQEELDRIIAARLAREKAHYADYDDLKAKAEKFEKALKAGKTELQNAIDRAVAAEKAASESAAEALRSSVALVKRLTPAQAKRLVGSTREELEADADELLSDLKAEHPTPAPVRPPRSGAGRGGETTDAADKRALARNLFGNNA